MNHIKKINFRQLKDCLINNNIQIKSDIKESETFDSLNSILLANSKEITFLLTDGYEKDIANTKAKACIVSEKNADLIPKECKSIIVNDTYKSFALITNLFSTQRKSNGIIADFVSIHDSSNIYKNVQIDSFVKIYDNCEIRENVIIESNCSIGPNVKIDKNTIIYSNSTLSNCIIGSNCIVKSGSVIGGRGFGFDPKSKIKIQHYGNVIIKDNCQIGSNTTIDRAVFESTIIEENSHIDNLVQIAHNVKVGKHAIIAAQCGIAGSTTIGDYVMIGGQTGISGHLNIGQNVKIAGKSGVTKNIKDNSIIAGFPATDIKKWKLSIIKLNK